MAEKKGFPGHLRVFSTVQRVVHWLIVVGFTLLVLTSLPLYLDSPIAQGDSGMLLKQWHRIGIVVTAVAALLFLLFDPRKLVEDMKKIFTWGSSDLGWLKAAPGYYFLGARGAMPEQDKGS
jgi:cytochrome b561